MCAGPDSHLRMSRDREKCERRGLGLATFTRSNVMTFQMFRFLPRGACALLMQQGPEARMLNVSPARKGWVDEDSSSAGGAALSHAELGLGFPK